MLTAFWNYLLVAELAHRVVHHDGNLPYRNPNLTAAFENVKALYAGDEETEAADFSERLLRLVDTIVVDEQQLRSVQSTSDITRLIHSESIRKLNDAVTAYLTLSRRDVWLLFDNLDKGWPIKAVRDEDILLLRGLLDATRKLQRQFSSRNIDLFATVFIRNDIYQHLILDPADRGKETAAILDWNDPELFEDVIGRRIVQSTGMDLSFDQIWANFFPAHVRGEDAFLFIISRTLMRPREVLRFMSACINTARTGVENA